MKLCFISYEKALSRHPNEVTKIISTLRKSKSKEKNVDVNEIQWSYEYCVKIPNSGSIFDLLNGKLNYVEPEDPIADYLERSSTVLMAKVRRWQTCENVINPPELEEQVKEIFK